ncbi:MAG: hypothetical protein ACK55Z_09235, partial [bacterium]
MTPKRLPSQCWLATSARASFGDSDRRLAVQEGPRCSCRRIRSSVSADTSRSPVSCSGPLWRSRERAASSERAVT